MTSMEVDDEHYFTWEEQELDDDDDDIDEELDLLLLSVLLIDLLSRSESVRVRHTLYRSNLCRPDLSPFSRFAWKPSVHNRRSIYHDHGNHDAVV